MKITCIIGMLSGILASIGFGFGHNWEACFWAAIAGLWALTSLIGNSAYQREKKEYADYRDTHKLTGGK
jgi:hypothetical protein